ncbi:MAG: hypothetical protein EOM20_19840 [Spartobacteria bacterium]|nr:hypothetical protein [Spartobacteria bacterium]
MKNYHVYYVGMLVFVSWLYGAQAQSRYEVLHTFDELDGRSPYGRVIFEEDIMYGMTRNGGANDRGAIYRMAADGSDYTVLHDFQGGDMGQSPYGSLVMFSNLLYGMTRYGGTNNRGIIFSIQTDGDAFARLFEFGLNVTNGYSPYGSLTPYLDCLYGLATYGGAYEQGAIFRFNPTNRDYTVLHHFDSEDGVGPYGDLLVENDLLYGMTTRGGSSNQGVVFSIRPDGNDYTLLHTFGEMPNDGARPYGSLISDGSRLYGLTSSGGTSTYGYYSYGGEGTLFAINPDGTEYEKLHDFSFMSAGFEPRASLIADGSRLYGTTPYGSDDQTWGYYGGCIFGLLTDGAGYNTLHSFSEVRREEGISPRCSLALYEDALYGVTVYGGSNNCGVIFRFTPRIAALCDFDGDGRADPGMFRPYSGMWEIDQSQAGAMRRQWGWNEAQPFVGDFDGDGRFDTAFYWPQEGVWYIWQSKDGIRVVQWGWADAVPVPADYNGDLRTDIAVYNPATGDWYILESGGRALRMENWGWESSVPVPGDYDGDGLADLAVYWPQGGNWYILYSGGGGLIRNWGWAQAIPVPGDYDGDEKTELGVYAAQDATWSILFSTGGSCITNFGTAACVPVPADYDGDRLTDLAFLEPDTGLWTIFNSDNGAITTHQLGDINTHPILPQHWINRWFGE